MTLNGVPSALKRSLSLLDLCVYGVGIIVGAGIYAVIGAAAAQAGSALWLSFLVATFVAAVTALSYAELVSMFPRAGAEYEFLKQAFPRFKAPAFVAGALVVVNGAATVATVALAFGGYLTVYLAAPIPLSAFLLVAVATGINIAGIRQATWVSMVLVCVEVGALVLFAGAGMTQPRYAEAVTLPEMDAWMGILSGGALIFFAYIGFEDIANLSEETKKPERNLPLALFISVAVTGVLYLAVTFAALAAVSPNALAASDSPLEHAASAISPLLGKIVAFAALFATASTALITLVGESRLLFGMARGGDLPAILAKTLPGRATPWVAALLLAAVAFALLPLGKVEIAASVSSLTILLIFIGVQLALIVLRYRAPEKRRPFRAPLNIGRMPVLPIVGIVCCIALTTQFELIVYAVAGLLIAAIAAAYFISTMLRRAR